MRITTFYVDIELFHFNNLDNFSHIVDNIVDMMTFLKGT